MSTVSHSTRSRGYLPHWESEHATYFVTFRLADSLPRDLLERLRQERDVLDRAKQAHSDVAPDQELARKLRAILQEAEQALDDGLGVCYMRDPRIAKIVADTILHFHGQRYSLWAWCVMPNHVHVIFSPLGEYTLESILHSWKSYSALEANKVLGRMGRFWQREYFDHLVRNEASLLKIARYVQENPQEAGLHNWPWVEVLP
jgi:REP element-mobilizing transposase RayT